MYDLLAGLSVIEASSFVASPTAGLYCAQMGAEVIRVDQIGGGPDFRRWPVTAANDSLYWENLNRAKKSVALDLGRPEGRELLQKLVRATGQFVTNFPVGGFLSHDKLAEGRADLSTVRVMGCRPVPLPPSRGSRRASGGARAARAARFGYRCPTSRSAPSPISAGSRRCSIRAKTGRGSAMWSMACSGAIS